MLHGPFPDLAPSPTTRTIGLKGETAAAFAAVLARFEQGGGETAQHPGRAEDGEKTAEATAPGLTPEEEGSTQPGPADSPQNRTGEDVPPEDATDTAPPPDAIAVVHDALIPRGAVLPTKPEGTLDTPAPAPEGPWQWRLAQAGPSAGAKPHSEQGAEPNTMAKARADVPLAPTPANLAPRTPTTEQRLPMEGVQTEWGLPHPDATPRVTLAENQGDTAPAPMPKPLAHEVPVAPLVMTAATTSPRFLVETGMQPTPDRLLAPNATGDPGTRGDPVLTVPSRNSKIASAPPQTADLAPKPTEAHARAAAPGEGQAPTTQVPSRDEGLHVASAPAKRDTSPPLAPLAQPVSPSTTTPPQVSETRGAAGPAMPLTIGLADPNGLVGTESGRDLLNGDVSRSPDDQTGVTAALSRTEVAPATRATLAVHGPAETALARSASEQISTRVSAEGGGFDLALHPEELGRVHMHLHRGEQGSILSIQAERPETLDLLRRNIAMLEQDLRALGHDSLTFRFSDGSAGGGQRDDAPHLVAGLADDISPDAALTPAPRRQHPASDRLDLRL